MDDNLFFKRGIAFISALGRYNGKNAGGLVHANHTVTDDHGIHTNAACPIIFEAARGLASAICTHLHIKQGSPYVRQ